MRRFDAELPARWQKIIADYNEVRLSAAEAVGNLDRTNLAKSIDNSITEFDACVRKLDIDKAALISSNPEVERAEVSIEIALLNDRNLLEKVKDKVEAYVAGQKWAGMARLKTSQLGPGPITKFAGTLYDKHISNEYLTIFNEESIHLNAPTFVKISQRNANGNTLRRLKIGGKNAIKILSEGEQRAIAIADFITEARLDPHNHGLFFDDPVSSQDHDRRENIANGWLRSLRDGRSSCSRTISSSFYE